MVWVLLALAAVSWVVVSSIRMGQGDTAGPPGSVRGADIPLPRQDRTEVPLAPTPGQILRTAHRRLGPGAAAFGQAWAADWRVARAVAVDGMHGLARLGGRTYRSAREHVEARRHPTTPAMATRERRVATMPSRTLQRRRSSVAGPATWYEVRERPWRTRVSALIELIMLVSVVGIVVAGAVAAAGVTVAQLVR
jgi:hypothetical protein